MNDPRAEELCRQNDIVGLFRYLGPMWIVPCMQILEDLLSKGIFYPNPDRYQQELRSAGIFVERMEVAMAAVLHKNARQITDEKFEEIYKDKLNMLDKTGQQRLEIRQFWNAGPKPGLLAGKQPISAAVANVGFDKYVDLYADCIYDMNYKIPPDKSFAYSSILQVKYPDGTQIELDIEKDFIDQPMTSNFVRDAMAMGRIGPGGRIFPAFMARGTVPRLWRMRMEAYRIQNEDFGTFATIAVTGVAFVLSTPAMPAGAIDEAALASTKVTRRRVPGVRRASAGGGGSGSGGGGPRIPGAPIQGKDVTEEVIRNAMKDAPLKSQQRGGISLPKVREFVDKLNAGETPPAIKVDDGIIVEGNHRYIAGRIVGKEPPIQPWAGGRPERVVSWDQMPISNEKW
jgi:hypothetical protein